MSHFAGKVALVTGASSGIGRAVALSFAEKGAKVFCTGTREAALKEVVAQIGSEGEWAAGDVSKEEDVKAIVEKCGSSFGKVDFLVNSAGVLKGGALGSVGVDNFDFNMSINARGVFLMMTHTLDLLRKGDGKSIVNISSVNGQQSFGGCLSYCASKAAVDSMTMCAAVDLAPEGIRVNGINPGVVITELQKRGGLSDEAYEGFLERSRDATHPLAAGVGRLAQPEDVANAVLFLSAPESAGFITGSTLRIDGGRFCLGAR